MRTRDRIIAAVQAVMMMVSFFTVSIPEAAAAEIEEIADQLMTDNDTELKEQLITAELYTDATYSEPFLTDTQITISGEMPENAYVKSYPVSYDIEGMSVIAAYDITIFGQDGVTVFQPQEQALNVTVSMQELADTDPDALAVYHIGDDGEEEITDITAEDGSVSFDAEHFSVYVISEHEDSDKPISDKRIEFHFLSDKFDTVDEEQGIYTAGLFSFRNKGLNSDMTQLEIQHSQILLNGETLEMIENPPNHSSNSETSPEQYFYGWYVVDLVERNSDSDIRYKWTDDPEPLKFEVPVNFSDSEWSQNGNAHELTSGDFDEDGCAHVYLAPLYTNYHFIDYHLYAHDNVTGDTSYEDTLLIRKLITFGANGKVNVRIGNISAPSPDAKHLVFIGWEREIKGDPKIDITVDNDGKERNYLSDVKDGNSTNADGYHIVCYYDELFKDGDEIIDANNIDLYPVFVEARWIDFNTNLAGSTYVTSRYLLSSELTGGLEDLVREVGIGLNITKFPVSKRSGYNFLGWYTGEGDGAVKLTDSDGNVLSNITYENSEQCYGVKDGAFYVNNAPDVGGNTADDAKNVKLYAKWQEITDTRYTVVIWKQKITDDVDTPENKREYDYEKSVHIDCITGTTLDEIIAHLSASSDETGRYYSVSRYVGFTPREPSMQGGNNNNTTVSSDGNTIINIYYDRNPINIVYNVKGNGSGNNWYEYRKYRGLYGQTLEQNNYKWPTEYWWYSEKNSSSTRTTFLDAFLPKNLSADQVGAYDLIFYGFSPKSNASKTIYFYKQKLDGQYDENDPTNFAETEATSFNITDKYNGFTASQYKADNGSKKDVSPKGSNGYYGSAVSYNSILRIYFKRNSYEIKYKVNYPTDKSGLTYANKLTGAEYASSYGKVLYEQPLNEYDEGGPKYWDISENAPDHYVFAGWYEDEEGQVKFDFDSTMPANNLVLYAKWEPVKFKIQVDPNGAEIDHINHKVANYCEQIYGAGNIPDGSEEIPTFKYSPLGNYYDKRATYFNIEYDEAIGEYSLSRPEYLPISDVAAQTAGVTIYYYVNTQLDESVGRVPADLRNALYLTESELESYYRFYTAVIDEYKKKEPHTYENVQELSFASWKHQYVSDQKYYKATNDTTTYLFRGWYEVDENGETSAMPYDFYDPVHSDIRLRAVWQLSGGFKIQYVPEYTAANGVIINGQMDQWQDPADNSNENYAEYAKVTVLKQPTHIMADGQPTDDYIFRGWQVAAKDGDKYIPMEDGVYYQPGEDYIIQSKFANDLNVIYMQAVYERDGSSYRRPEIANLKLDAADGQVDYTLPSTFTLEETRAKLGYIFKGWAYTPNSTNEYYTVTGTQSQILYLKDMFDDPALYTQPNETFKQIKLYAVWEKDVTADKVYIHKDVPFPGNKDEEFAFTLNLTLRNNSATRSASETVYIRSGEYFLVENTGFTAGGSNSTGSATSTITIYKKDGSTESKTLSVNMTANGLCSYNMTVTENEHPHYTATSEVVVDTSDDGYHIDSSDSNVSWNNANAGGTVLFTNVRKTADVTVQKVVDDPKHLHDGKTFKFSAELKDGEQDYTYELASSEFSIEDGGYFTIKDVPVGAKLLISENEADFTTVVESENGSVDTGTDSNVQTFLLEVPENDETLTFKNTVRTAKVEIYSWDGDKDVPFADARYSISTETYDKYPDKTSGLVWKFDDMSYGTYTIEQIWCDNTHEKINTPMTIQISGTTDPIVTSGNKFIEVEYDAGNQVYKVKILNYKKLIAPTGADTSCTRALTALTISVSLVCAALYIVCSQRRKGGSSDEIL